MTKYWLWYGANSTAEIKIPSRELSESLKMILTLAITKIYQEEKMTQLKIRFLKLFSKERNMQNEWHPKKISQPISLK